MKPVSRVLAVLIGILSVVSLVQRLLEVGVVGVLVDFLDYYRLVSSLVFGLLMMLVAWTPSQEFVDVWTLSFLGASAYIKTPGIERSRGLQWLPRS